MRSNDTIDLKPVVTWRAGTIQAVYERPSGGIVVTGSPDRHEKAPDHNCDAMGCGLEHVLYRSDSSTPPVPEALPEWATLRLFMARKNVRRDAQLYAESHTDEGLMVLLADRLDARERENKALRDGPEGRDFYRRAWQGAVSMCEKIAKRCGFPTDTQEPPEGLYTTFVVFTEFADRLEAENAHLTARAELIDQVRENLSEQLEGAKRWASRVEQELFRERKLRLDAMGVASNDQGLALVPDDSSSSRGSADHAK